MRLFPRLLLNHLVVVTVTAAVLLVSAELAAHPFIQRHVQEMIDLIGPEGGVLREDLTHGMRDTLTQALMAALPLALLVATVTAWVAARRVTASVRSLQAGSRSIASGEYSRRLPETGQDELAGLARSFNTMACALERVEQTRVELIGNVAHELRTPVAAVRGYAEAAQDGVLPSEQALNAIAREVAGMERLVHDLSLVSRVESGRVDLHLTAVPVSDLLVQAQERFQMAFEDRGITLQMNTPPPEIRVHVDPQRAQQVLANLLSNALRYTPPGGKAWVSAAVQGRHLTISVTDTGPGIAPEHLERVFERFFRADLARTRGDGSGVGLTIARGLARAMQGDLRVNSRPGQGASFHWRMPLSPELPHPQ